MTTDTFHKASSCKFPPISRLDNKSDVSELDLTQHENDCPVLHFKYLESGTGKLTHVHTDKQHGTREMTRVFCKKLEGKCSQQLQEAQLSPRDRAMRRVS